MSLTLENSLGNPVGPRKGHGSTGIWGESSIVRSSPAAGGKRQELTPRPVAFCGGEAIEKEVEQRGSNGRKGRTESSLPGTQLSPPSVQRSPSLGE